MPTIGTSVDIAALLDATTSGKTDRMIVIGRELLQRGAPAAELLARAGMIAVQSDTDGHVILMLDAAAIISRWFLGLPKLSDAEPPSYERELPLLIQALVAARPAIQAGMHAHPTFPDPLFPSGIPEGTSVGDVMHKAVDQNDPQTIERLLFGLYGTGADYRTSEVRTYDAISTTFQNAGHPLMLAVRGYQLLDAAEWGQHTTPNVLHWMAPHLALHAGNEPAWINDVRAFNSEPSHSLASLRTRLAAPKEESALPLLQLVQSDAGTTQICQGVYDALIKGGASSHGVGSVIALAATNIMQMVGDGNRDNFVQAAHGLLYAAAVRLVYKQVQDIDALPLLYTAAAYVNSLYKAITEKQQSSTTPMPAIPVTPLGGGLIASSMLDTLQEQLIAQDLDGAYITARRYVRLGNDPRALFATIGLVAAQTDAAADQGHTLQMVQASGEAFISWPAQLNATNIEGFLQVALRASAYGKRNSVASNL
jgi:hypothetical protein